jgi:hypothetical protein
MEEDQPKVTPQQQKLITDKIQSSIKVEKPPNTIGSKNIIRDSLSKSNRDQR